MLFFITENVVFAWKLKNSFLTVLMLKTMYTILRCTFYYLNLCLGFTIFCIPNFPQKIWTVLVPNLLILIKATWNISKCHELLISNHLSKYQHLMYDMITRCQVFSSSTGLWYLRVLYLIVSWRLFWRKTRMNLTKPEVRKFYLKR